MRIRTSTDLLSTLTRATFVSSSPALGFSTLMQKAGGGEGGTGDGGSGGGSDDGGGDGNGKAGDGDGGDGKDGDGDGDGRGKTGLLADAGKKGDGDGGDGSDGDDGGKGAASGDGGEGETKVELLSLEERPDWLPENFYDKDNKGVHLHSLVKSHNDLRTKVADFNKGKPKAPEKATDYTFEFDGAGIRDNDGNDILAPDTGKPYTVEKNDPIVQAFAQAAHKKGISQEDFQDIASDVYRAMIMHSHENYDFYNQAAEEKKLGEGGKALAEGIHTWLGALQSRGTISQAEFNEAMELGKYANGIRFLNKMRTLTGEMPIPTTGEGFVEGEELSDEELHALVGTEKYRNDPKEQERVRALFVKRYGTQPGGASPKGLGVHTKPFENKPVKSTSRG